MTHDPPPLGWQTMAVTPAVIPLFRHLSKFPGGNCLAEWLLGRVLARPVPVRGPVGVVTVATWRAGRGCGRGWCAVPGRPVRRGPEASPPVRRGRNPVRFHKLQLPAALGNGLFPVNPPLAQNFR